MTAESPAQITLDRIPTLTPEVTASPVSRPIPEQPDAHLTSIVSEATFRDTLDRIGLFSEVVVDVETDGLQAWHGNQLCGLGIAVSGEEGYYFAYRHPENNLDYSKIGEIWDVLSGMRRLIGHNLKFDLGFLYQDGYDPPRGQVLADTLVAARLCSSDKFPQLGLSKQLEEWVDPMAAQYEVEFKTYLKSRKIKKFSDAPAEIVGSYCIDDTLGTWKLKEILEAFISSTDQQRVWANEQALTYTLWRMECEGIMLDSNYGSIKIPQMKARINQMEQEIYQLAGQEFNMRSSKQLTEVMNGLGIHSPKKSEKTGKEMWSSGIMLSIDHPIAGKILELRGLEKVLGTYLEPLMTWPESTVHCQHKNWGTVTGRLSCSNPNLQNMAKNVQDLQGNAMDEETLKAVAAFLGTRTDGGYQDMRAQGGSAVGGVSLGGMMGISSGFQELDSQVSVRRMFISRPEHRLYMLDYSQMEMRVFADYVQDSALMALLESSTFDFHSHVVKTVWEIDEDHDLWNFYRTLAKAINFGLIYGIGVKKLAQQLQRTVEEAKEYKVQYFNRFPLAETFVAQVNETAKERGYLFNRFKRRYWIDPSRTYIGVNYLVQGTSADIVKSRMNACQQFIEENNCRSKMMVQVHDEMIFDVHDDESDWFPFEMQRIMQERQIETFLPVDISRGAPSWAQVEEYDAETQEWKGK